MLGYLFFVGNRKATPLLYQSQPDEQCDWYHLRHEGDDAGNDSASGGSRL